ncbi:uncharacterized protein LOC135493042 [Lineus longissimus]|uniref:uncharacterized protein LOC135493042 n=1 Tax=Lineus longissimus TaxID=88925 RepID=UPI002B4DE75C
MVAFESYSYSGRYGQKRWVGRRIYVTLALVSFITVMTYLCHLRRKVEGRLFFKHRGQVESDISILVYKKPFCYPSHSLMSSDVCALIHQFINADDFRLLMDIFDNFKEMAEVKGWQYFIFMGTLLGSWRHHGQIKWDADIDVFLNISVRDDVINTLSALPGYNVVQRESVKMLKMQSDSSYQEVVDNVMGTWWWPAMDIFFYEENATHVFDADPKRRWGLLQPKTAVFPLRMRPFEKHSVPVPNKPEMCLERMYGSGYMDDCVGLKISVKCEALRDITPLVDRKQRGQFPVETLRIGDIIIQQVKI